MYREIIKRGIWIEKTIKTNQLLRKVLEMEVGNIKIYSDSIQGVDDFNYLCGIIIKYGHSKNNIRTRLA